MYLIVEFQSNEIALVPKEWMVASGREVRYPPYKTDLRIRKAARSREPPSENWTYEQVKKILYQDEDYEKVSLRMKKAEETSDLATSDEERSKRKRKPAKKLYESDSDSDLSDDNEGPKRKPASSSALTSDSPGSQSLFAATRCTYTPPPLPSLRMSAVSSPSVSHRPPQATPSPVAGGCSSTPVRPVQAPLAHSIGTGAVTQILTILEEMREEQRGIKRLLNQLVLQGGPVPDNMNALPEGISFPVSSLEAMEALEELLQDANNATAVARYMYTIGGVDIREMVDRFMKETLTNNVAKMYNMKGLKGKQKFGDLSLLKILFRCVQRNPATHQSTLKDVELEVSKWLTGSRDRDGGRTNRRKRPTQGNSSDNAEEN
ncbi:uncharacterized protein LOC128236763 [Mya arenaria]|uniref:uncharacterized protein LOC128236763 n=2 Tax=Mya arenaria TaxID=6604 RepID=UPI0022DF4CF8|nr:uncharacterized protein LOC128236763 [Mya arenaria]